MQEDFLHYIWNFKKFDSNNLATVYGKDIVLLKVGQHNLNAGPDFFNSQLKIDDQLWAGNVEIHIKTSDWYVHHHETNPAYDNVILHVVWEHDVDVFRKDNTLIPTLELKDLVNKSVLKSYNKLFSKSQKWINCEYDFGQVDSFLLQNWLERLYFERLEKKSLQIENLLETSKQDWEAVLFKMLAKSFGLKVNGDAFYSMASSFSFSVVRKLQSNAEQLEALFFGQSGLLNSEEDEAYFFKLQQEYTFIKGKFKLENSQVITPQFFRLRPPNFPVIRLSQLACLYAKEPNLFSKLMEANTIEDLYKLLTVKTSAFWDSHYTFKKASKPMVKKTSNAFIDLIIINTILPLKFLYARYKGTDENEDLSRLVQNISLEKNSIIEKFEALRTLENSALQSQGLIELKNEYCSNHKCLQCAVGNAVLKKEIN